MNLLEVFLKALEERLSTKEGHKGVFIQKVVENKNILKPHSEFIEEVWLVDSSEKQLITKSRLKVIILNEDDKAKALGKLNYLSIVALLKYYGL